MEILSKQKLFPLYRKAAFIALFFAGFASIAGAKAQDVMGIAAIVNEEIISAFDLQARTQMTIVTSGLQDDPRQRSRLESQVLKSLIDERLQLQEAEKQNIKVSDAEIDRELAGIEKRNRMPEGGMVNYFKQNNLSLATFRQQVRAQLAWTKLVRRQIVPKVEVSDDEIKEVLQKLQEAVGLPQNLVSEIFLTIDSPDQEDETMKEAQRLVDQLRQGANFPAIAQQFSQSASAASGGDLGWVSRGQLPDALGKVVETLQPGDISNPVRSFGGVHILALRERQIAGQADPSSITLKLRQLVFDLPPNAPPQAVAAAMQKLKEIRSHIKSCEDLMTYEKSGSTGTGDLGEMRMSDLPGTIRQALSNVKAGESSEPIRAPATAQIITVCDRKEATVKPPTAEDARQRLEGQKADLMQRRYLRDLRRDAYLDVRG